MLKYARLVLMVLCGAAFSLQTRHDALASPSNSISVPNTFSAGEVISSSETNANNNEIQTKFNAHSHTDVTQLGTVTVGTWQGGVLGMAYGGTGADFSATVIGNTFYFSSTGVISALAPQTSGKVLTTQGVGAAPVWQDIITACKIGSFTRVIETAAGDATVSGVGFRPRAVIFYAGFTTGEPIFGMGASDGTTDGAVRWNGPTSADTWITDTANALAVVPSNGETCFITAVAFTGDGFTCTWTQPASATGTLTINYVAIR